MQSMKLVPMIHKCDCACRNQKEILKALETPEEKRARRLAKKVRPQILNCLSNFCSTEYSYPVYKQDTCINQKVAGQINLCCRN